MPMQWVTANVLQAALSEEDQRSAEPLIIETSWKISNA
jgi:hypothetical protein